MLLLDNDDVDALLAMEDCIGAIEAVYREADRGEAAYRPRATFQVPRGTNRRFTLATMDGVSRAAGVAAVRIRSDFVISDPARGDEEKYASEPGSFCGLVLLFDLETAEPLAILNDGRIQQLRVGATAAVAARQLARPSSRILAVIGAGTQARAHVEAYVTDRPIREVRVFSPNAVHRDAFAAEIGAGHDVAARPVATAREAVEGADIVAACTSSTRPVLEAGWLAPGTHLSSVRHRAEIGPDVLSRADRVVVHVPSGATAHRVGAPEELREAGISRPSDETPTPRDAPTLADLLAGRTAGRSGDDEVTYFLNNMGTGLQFAACAGLVHLRALEAGRGREIPTGWFLQSISD